MNKNQDVNINKRLKRFRLRNIKPYTTMALIGMRGTGKTSIIKYILYYNYKKIRIPFIISSTAHINDDYKGMIPDVYIYENYDSHKINRLISDQCELKNKIEKGYISRNVKKNSYLIMDDIVGTDPIWKKDKNFKRTFFAGRHFWLSNIISVQSPMHIPADYRDNIDYIIVTTITTDKRKKSFFENFWNSRFGDYKTFCNVFDGIMSKKFNFMLIDNKSAKSSDCDSIEKYVYWGRTHHPKNIIVKKLGIGFIWNLNKKYFNENWIMKYTMNDMNTIKKKRTRPKIELVDDEEEKTKQKSKVVYT